MPNMGSKYGTYKLPNKPSRMGRPDHGNRRVQISGPDWSMRDKRTEFVHNPPNPDEGGRSWLEVVQDYLGRYVGGEGQKGVSGYGKSKKQTIAELEEADIPTEPPAEGEEVEQYAEEYEED